MDCLFLVMQKFVLKFLFFLFLSTNSYCQDSLLIGRKYFEDQIYTGITYNTLTYEPKSLERRGISTGLQLGFIKDIPLNKKGSFALGLGVGYAYNGYNYNLKISKVAPIYTFIEDDYTKNKITTHSVEIPFELRFRLTSTPTVYQFWRIYIGGKIGFIYSSYSHFENDVKDVKIKNLTNLNELYYGPQIAIGYNAINLYVYYNINPLFAQSESTTTMGISEIRKISMGLQFYIF